MMLSSRLTACQRPRQTMFILTRSRQSFSSLSSSSSSSTTKKVTKENQKRIDVAIVGAPNAGKSQLLNCITQSNIAAVSRKRHTTRNEILGIRTINDTQMVFVDTPGYLRLQTAKQENLLRNLVVTANTEIDHADYTLLVIDAAKNLDEGLKEALVALMLRAVHLTRTGLFGIVLNKVDLVTPKKKLLDIATAVESLAISCIQYDEEKDTSIAGIQPSKMKDIHSKLKNQVHVSTDDQKTKSNNDDRNHNKPSDEEEEFFYPEIFYTSALQNDGVDDIIQYLLRIAPKEEWIYESHESSQLSPIERVEEIIREKIYRSVHKEVPHNVNQVNRVFDVYKRKVPKERIGDNDRHFHNKHGFERLIRIDQDLVVKTESHKRILRGKNGRILARIQEQAQKDLERLFQCRVSLNLHVKKSKSQHDRHLSLSEPFDIEMS